VATVSERTRATILVRSCVYFHAMFFLFVCAGSVHSVQAEVAERVSECTVDLSPSPGAAESVAVVQPMGVKLPLRAVSDRMNAEASVESPLRRPGKASGSGADVADVDRFPLSANENTTTETAEGKWSTGYDGDAHSNSDDEVCDVFSRARRFQTMSGWLSCELVDGRWCVRLLRAAAALAAGVAHSNRLPRRWLHDSRTTATMNAIELPRPYLDFTKMQVLGVYLHRTQTEIQ